MSRLRLAVLCDARDEGWPSMELVGEMLLATLEGPLAAEVEVTALRPTLPRLARRLPGVPPRLALNADRFAGRYLALPLRARGLPRALDAYHVVDHSYAHLARSLPAGRSGVFCHDADAFRSLFDPRERRPAWFRALARHVLSGLQRAAVVFHSTQAVREELVRHGLVDPARLVHAPYGVAPELRADGPASSIASGRYLLHVGSGAPRKRLDLLLDVFARVRGEVPDLTLVQVGAALGPELRAQAERLGLTESALVQPPPLSRADLAALYRGATLVLLPSDSEGFGLPVLEALACGAPVLSSDLPVLREVAGGAALYAPPGDAGAWVDLVLRVLDGRTAPPPRTERLAQVRQFTWEAHARAILHAYRRIQ